MPRKAFSKRTWRWLGRERCCRLAVFTANTTQHPYNNYVTDATPMPQSFKESTCFLLIISKTHAKSRNNKWAPVTFAELGTQYSPCWERTKRSSCRRQHKTEAGWNDLSAPERYSAFKAVHKASPEQNHCLHTGVCQTPVFIKTAGSHCVAAPSCTGPW